MTHYIYVDGKGMCDKCLNLYYKQTGRIMDETDRQIDCEHIKPFTIKADHSLPVVINSTEWLDDILHETSGWKLDDYFRTKKSIIDFINEFYVTKQEAIHISKVEFEKMTGLDYDKIKVELAKQLSVQADRNMF